MAIAIPAASKKRPELTPDINVTPLVDVVLVLLIIFMVIAPSLENGERVELPGVFQPDKQQKSKLDPITVTVGASGNLYLEKERVERPVLEAKLNELHEATPDRRVVLKGDGTVAYEKVREIFALVQDRGFSGCSLMVQKRKVAGEKDEEGEN